MNPKTHTTPEGCDSIALQVLLAGDESQADFARVAEHVERCPTCQQRLEQLVADGPQWSMVGELLSDCQLDASTAGDLNHTQTHPAVSSASTGHQRLQEHLRSVLAASSHPEMLGRLGRYDIESVIGSGGMGIVLRGFDTELHRPVAVKILASHLAHSGPARQRFARESRAAAAVVHEHVVAIHDVQSDGETPFLVMQYVAGESLQTRVDRLGPLSAKEILRIAMQAAAGLQAAHAQGVVHRDIKPANILLEPGVERALVTDFGLARTVDDASLTQTGVVAGSPHYMSPEQALGQPTDVRTDLFSLGAVMYFMASGHPPFRAERAMGVLNRICHEPHRPLWEANPELPDALCEIVDRCLQKRASRRFGSAQELHEVLSQTLSRMQQRPLPTRSRWLRELRRSRWALPALAIAPLVLAAVISAGSWWNRQRLQPLTSESTTVSASGRADGGSNVQQRFAPEAFTTEVWLQASQQEQAAWEQEVRALQQAITAQQQHGEATSLLPSNSSFTHEAWSLELQQLRQQLEQAEQ